MTTISNATSTEVFPKSVQFKCFVSVVRHAISTLGKRPPKNLRTAEHTMQPAGSPRQPTPSVVKRLETVDTRNQVNKATTTTDDQHFPAFGSRQVTHAYASLHYARPYDGCRDFICRFPVLVSCLFFFSPSGEFEPSILLVMHRQCQWRGMEIWFPLHFIPSPSPFPFPAQISSRA